MFRFKTYLRYLFLRLNGYDKKLAVECVQNRIFCIRYFKGLLK